MICELRGPTNQKIIRHHLSYQPEKVIHMCRTCHAKIHLGPMTLLYPSDIVLLSREQLEEKNDGRTSSMSYKSLAEREI